MTFAASDKGAMQKAHDQINAALNGAPTSTGVVKELPLSNEGSGHSAISFDGAATAKPMFFINDHRITSAQLIQQNNTQILQIKSAPVSGDNSGSYDIKKVVYGQFDATLTDTNIVDHKLTCRFVTPRVDQATI